MRERTEEKEERRRGSESGAIKTGWRRLLMSWKRPVLQGSATRGEGKVTFDWSKEKPLVIWEVREVLTPIPNPSLLTELKMTF